MNRLERAIQHLHENDMGCALVSKPENIYYLTGFFPHASSLLILDSEPVLLITKMDSTRDITSAVDYEVVKDFKDRLKAIKEKKIGVEKGRLTLSFWEKHLRGKELLDLGFLEEMRAVKDRGEIKEITKAVEVTEECLGGVSLRGTEKDAALTIEVCLRKAADSAFEPIVAGGKNSAVPHHRPTDGEIAGPVIVDLGARVNHYCADMTRTFLLDTEEAVERYRIVLEAQEAGIRQARDGNEIRAVDRAVREVLAEYGYLDDFLHSSGHGVGLEVHEAPTLNSEAEGSFKKGMVVSVEPGIYRDFGIRMEDMVLVGKRPKLLTSFKR
ncbi:MAG: aminopeptidase P family protein [Euryarchaeota archaeon]|nr:aminopeptidase P family protein [Euryarchaeota archaeon]